MKILIVKLSALGDVVQSLPVAMAIKNQAPEARIDWVVERPASGLLMGHPALNRVLVSPRHLLAEGLGGFFPGLLSFSSKLRSVTYDAVLDLQGLIKSAMVVSLSRGKRKLGFKGGKEPLSALALNEAQPPFDPDRHALERYLDILGPLGLERPAQPAYGLKPTRDEESALDKLLEPIGAGAPYLVLHPMAKWKSKLWPEKHWAGLADILGGWGWPLVISGSKGDQKVSRSIIAQMNPGLKVLDLCGRTSLRELAALLKRARAVICTDTGAMHLAAAMQTQVFALFGPTAPWRTGPHGSGHMVMRLDKKCSPCFKRECESPHCLTDISADRAAAKIDPWLEQIDSFKSVVE
jgi:heptosyltransferase-1